MKISRIKIRNILGITERELGSTSLELMGPKGAGKTSVLDAIRWALTNKSDRDWIIKQGADEGEILIETDTGLSIERKARTTKADMIKVKEGNLAQGRPAEFLAQIFTPLQLNPVLFTQLSAQEKNRMILNLIEFDWDIGWIEKQFGEIPKGVNYQQHILQVLSDIQSDGGVYYMSRQEINSRKLHLKKSVEDLAATIPEGYHYEKWRDYKTGEKYTELEKARHNNGLIEKAQAFAAAYKDKLRALEADREIAKAAAEKEIAEKWNGLNVTIERLRAEILALEKERDGLRDKQDQKIALINSQYETAKAQLKSDTDVSQEWAEKPKTDTTGLEAEIKTAEAMRLHLNEYQSMIRMQDDIEKQQEQSDELTRKIELARNLPGEILKTATIPVDGLTVENGKPFMYGRPITNLSDGELLELCVDVTIQKPGGLQILLLDKAEGLDTKSREKLYAKCKEKGLQLIATRVTDSDELEVVEL
jgi:hypothetical protein